MKKKPNTPVKPSQVSPYIYLGLILLLTIVVFTASLSNGFVSFDDEGYVTQNPLITDLSFKGIKAIFTSFVMANYHPLSVLLHAILYRLFGLQPMPYHLLNLLLHLVNIVLVYRLVKELLGKDNAALLAACLFAIHPMHVESVCWASDLKDVLFTCFYLGAMLLYISYVKNRQVKFLIVCGILFLGALLSKSAAVTLPVVLLLVDYYYNRKLSFASTAEKAPFFILSLVFGIINLRSQGSAGAFTDIAAYNIIDRICIPTYNLVYYTLALLLPFKLSVLHPLPVKTNGSLPLVYYLSPVALLLLVAVLVWSVNKYTSLRRVLVFGSLFFLITISLTIQLLPVGQAIVSERYTYLPYVGLLLIAGYLYSVYTNSNAAYKMALHIFLVGVILGFSVASFQRTKVWENSITLLTDVIEKYPDYAKGYEWRAEVYKASGNYPNAIADFTKAIELNPQLWVAYNNRGICRRDMGDLKGALEDYTKTLELDSTRAEAYSNIGVLRQGMGDYAGAIQYFDKAIAIDPAFGSYYYNRAIAKKFAKDYNGAIEDYTKAIQLNKIFTEAYAARAEIKMTMGDYPAAVKDYDTAITINPNRAEQYNNRGEVYRYMQNYTAAMADYNKCIELDAGFLAAYNNRGIVKYFMNDLNGSVADFTSSIRIKPDASAYSNRANVKLKLNDAKGAIDDYTAAINVNANSVQAYEGRALVRNEIGDRTGACADWVKASTLGSSVAQQYLQSNCR